MVLWCSDFYIVVAMWWMHSARSLFHFALYGDFLSFFLSFFHFLLLSPAFAAVENNDIIIIFIVIIIYWRHFSLCHTMRECMSIRSFAGIRSCSQAIFKLQYRLSSLQCTFVSALRGLATINWHRMRCAPTEAAAVNDSGDSNSRNSIVSQKKRWNLK